MSIEEAKEVLENFIITKLDNIELKEAMRVVLNTLNENAL